MAVPKELSLLFACSGIFFSFSYFAVLQEDVYKKPYGEAAERFQFTFLALAVERGVNALIALLGVLLLGSSGCRIPHKEIAASGVSQMLAMAGSNESLRYVSFATQVLGKSCKMVPVMAGGLLLGGKRYTLMEYVQVIMVTVGVCVFNFGGKSKAGNASDSAYGLLLIAFSLLMDAVTGGLQDKVKLSTKKLNPNNLKAKPTMHESMFYTNLSGVFVALALAAATGHLQDGLAFCVKFPDCLSAIVIYSVASAVGQNFIYYTITQFNPLVLSTVTTTRKIFSTVYSVLRNPSNSLDNLQWTGCSLVFLGLLFDILDKYASKKPPSDKAKEMKPAPSDAKQKQRTKKAE
ncbi:hypothetical protein AB1Y20_015239 [Prymnesium parvum]|uniref:Solute carrier family 35 member B1 n=1 Tax=Prymnesium parvum TaxID=97485 RepID=A0AB34JX87_PRYPA